MSSFLYPNWFGGGGGGGDGAILDGVTSSIKATVFDFTNSNPLSVAIVDTLGDQITSFGGGTQYTEDDVSVANPIGTQVIARRRDSLASETSTDGAVTAVNSTAKGELYVKQTDPVPASQSGSWTVDTELPTAAALTDNFANPTAPAVGAFNMLWDGATWDRAAGTTVDGALVNLGANNDVTVTGTVTANQGGSWTVDTELPAASALADNFANPTAPGVGAFGMLWDGATWDRQPGNSTDGTLVNLGANNDVTVTGTVTANQGGSWTVDTELPAAAALADNTANPTVPAVGAFGMFWDGTNWDRALKAVPSSDDVASTSFAGLVVTTTNYVYDGTNWDRQRGTSAGGTWVQGNVAHDSPDTDNPVKIGFKAFNLAPTTTAVEVGPTAVAANDRADAMGGLKGELTEHPLGVFHTLTALNISYDTTTTETATSANIDSFKYRRCTVGMTIDSTGAPTDLQIIVEISLDGTNYFEMKNGALGQWIYDDTYVATAKSVAYTFDIACRSIRVKITGTGLLAATNFFDVTNACLYLSN